MDGAGIGCCGSLFSSPQTKKFMFYGFIEDKREYGEIEPGVLCVSTVCLNVLRCASSRL
jgi:hypothetical protein